MYFYPFYTYFSNWLTITQYHHSVPPCVVCHIIFAQWSCIFVNDVWMPIDSDTGIFELLNGFVKACLSNITPRTGEIRVDIDVDHLYIKKLDYNLRITWWTYKTDSSCLFSLPPRGNSQMAPTEYLQCSLSLGLYPYGDKRLLWAP